MKKRIITAAVTGSMNTPTMSPYLPITPEEIATHAIEACEAGAAVVHIHARDPRTGKPSSDMEVYSEIFRRIRNGCNAIICASTGGGLGMPVAERIKVVPTHHPDLASFNSGAVNFGLFDRPRSMGITEWKHDWEKPYLDNTANIIYGHTFASLEEFARIFYESGTKPEAEIFDSGMITNLAYLAERGIVRKPVYLQFVLGILGGIHASLESLMFLYHTARSAFGEHFEWSVCATGTNQLPLCTAGLVMGSHARVGMEDSLVTGPDTLAKSSAEQVEKLVHIAHELSLEIATPDEARQILGLPPR